MSGKRFLNTCPPQIGSTTHHGPYPKGICLVSSPICLVCLPPHSSNNGDCLLVLYGGRHCAKYFACMFRLNSHKILWGSYYYCPLLSMRTQSSEEVSLRLTQPVGFSVKTQTQFKWPPKSILLARAAESLKEVQKSTWSVSVPTGFSKGLNWQYGDPLPLGFSKPLCGCPSTTFSPQQRPKGKYINQESIFSKLSLWKNILYLVNRSWQPFRIVFYH